MDRKNKFAKKAIDKLAEDSEEMESDLPVAEPARFVERSIMLGVSMETRKGWLKGASMVRMREEVSDGETHEEVSKALGKLVFETAQEDFVTLVKKMGSKQ